MCNKAHLFQAIDMLLPSNQSLSADEADCVQAAVTLYNQQMGKLSVSHTPSPQGQSREIHLVENYAVWRAFLLSLSQCHAPPPNIGASFHLRSLSWRFNKNTNRQTGTVKLTDLFSPRGSVLIDLNLLRIQGRAWQGLPCCQDHHSSQSLHSFQHGMAITLYSKR